MLSPKPLTSGSGEANERAVSTKEPSTASRSKAVRKQAVDPYLALKTAAAAVMFWADPNFGARPLNPNPHTPNPRP
jgi:hypothetical protein